MRLLRLPGIRPVAVLLGLSVIFAAAVVTAQASPALEVSVLYTCAREDGLMRLVQESATCRNGEAMHS